MHCPKLFRKLCEMYHILIDLADLTWLISPVNVGEPVSSSGPVLLAYTYYTAPPTVCLLMNFYIRFSFSLISAQELSSYLKSKPSALLQNLLCAHNETLLSLIYCPASAPPENHQFCLLLWVFPAHISSALK